MEYAKLKIGKTLFMVPTALTQGLILRHQKTLALFSNNMNAEIMTIFAARLSTETLLSYSESLEMSNKLFMCGRLNEAIEHYNDTDFEGFMNYYTNLKLKGILI